MVFAGTGAVVADQMSGGSIGPLGIAIAFGIAVMIVVHAIGDLSGAHINPAVTIGFALAGTFPWRLTPLYVTFQIGGALLASLLLSWYAPPDSALGMTVPAVSVGQTVVLEIVLTIFLMFVILSVAYGSRERGITAALAIGGVVALNSLFAGHLTGASMNPARSIGPAVAAGNLDQLWIYVSAPVVGAGLAVPLALLVYGRTTRRLSPDR
jgi:aquaporin Z